MGWASSQYAAALREIALRTPSSTLQDAAALVVHAATVDWQQDRRPPFMPPEADFSW
jgi:hypothetical protein